jgi:hypothetical protein
MAAFADPFDSLLISDMDIFAPPAAADAAGQKDFDPMNPGSPVATVKARVSTLGRPREFKSDKKVAIAYNGHLHASLCRFDREALAEGRWRLLQHSRDR